MKRTVVSQVAFLPLIAIQPRGSIGANIIGVRPYHRGRLSYVSKSMTKIKTWKISNMSEPEQTGSSAEDEMLQVELQQKVKELFGSRQNVTINMDTESEVAFNVRRAAGPTEEEQRKSAISVITTIVILSIAAGALFTGLYYNGAIHGSDNSNKRYEMPSYGSKSYMDPFELLEEDRQFQESKQ